jgi:sugar (pentulose or hexulose) kinase
MSCVGHSLRCEAAGLPVAQLWMVGGAAQSPYWPQILADITNLPIQLPQYDAWPALGAAILAGVGSWSVRRNDRRAAPL